MFAYCTNNPTNYKDHSGQFAQRCTQNIDEGYSNSVSQDQDDLSPGTVSVGITFSYGSGFWTYFVQISQATDLQGNSELQFAFGVGLAPGKGSSISGNMTFTNAPSVEYLHGLAHQIGATYGGVGGDMVLIPDPDNPNEAYTGFSVFSGTPSTDVHYNMSYTIPIIPNSFNLLEFADSVYRSYWGIY